MAKKPTKLSKSEREEWTRIRDELLREADRLMDLAEKISLRLGDKQGGEPA